jgi:hypothetical protein
LHAGKKRVAIQLRVGRRVLDAHLFEADLELFGDQHGNRRVDSLTHFDIGHGENDLSVPLDADEGVGRKGPGAGRVGLAAGEGQAQAQHQPAAGRCGGLDEVAPRENAGGGMVRVSLAESNAIEDHCRTPLQIDCAACLMASRMRT